MTFFHFPVYRLRVRVDSEYASKYHDDLVERLRRAISRAGNQSLLRPKKGRDGRRDRSDRRVREALPRRSPAGLRSTETHVFEGEIPLARVRELREYDVPPFHPPRPNDQPVESLR